jgi:prepilin-type N-terminal cleavage/methylation domain-containing protein
MNPTKNHRGFTLVEILFALATGLVVMGAVYMAMITGQRSSVGIEQRISAAQDVRASLEIMSMEIGMASYNPNFVPGIWLAPAGCANPSGSQGYRGIQVATPTALTVEMDINENGAVGDPNEVIAYVYENANLRITRSTNCGGAQPFLGEVAGTQGRSVRVINGDPAVNIPVFRYFDNQGVEILAASLPAAIPNIRRIEIALVVETENVDPTAPASQRRQRMVYTNGVILRNHAFSL